MRLYASNELKSRLTHAAANGSVIAADILSELKKNRPAQEIIRGSYSFLSTKRKWTDCGSFRKIRIVFTAFNKDPEHPNLPDRPGTIHLHRTVQEPAGIHILRDQLFPQRHHARQQSFRQVAYGNE